VNQADVDLLCIERYETLQRQLLRGCSRAKGVRQDGGVRSCAPLHDCVDADYGLWQSRRCMWW